MKKIISSICLTISLLVLVLLVAARVMQPEPAAAEQIRAEAEELVKEETPEPTPEPTPTPTPEPTPELFTISVIGDCTLTSHQKLAEGSPYHYGTYMNGDYSYPFKNTVKYFENDDFTIGNLECSFSDVVLGHPDYVTFYFRAPSEWANILVEGKVDFVTTANNHTMDFFEAGRDFTYEALENVNMPYGKNDEAQIITTDSGLKLGIYCAFDSSFIPSTEKAIAAIEELKEQGAEYIICAFHWGIELHYQPEQGQIDLAHACIDAGADLIYGSHPHVLQPIEEYNDGLILYSMGNWSFGGSTQPKDCDTAIVQVKVKRDLDGTVTTDGYDIIPCCISSTLTKEANGGYYNDYCPTPYEEGTEAYERALSKIDGSYEGGNLQADYTNWHESWG